MRGRIGKRYILFLIFAEVAVLITLLVILISRSSADTKTSMADWKSNYITFDDGWYADEDIVETETPIDLIFGPYIDLKRGDYSVTVEYESDYEQKYIVYTMAEDTGYIEFASGKLRQSQNRITQDFALTRDIEGLEIVVKYDGQGTLRVKNIEIEPDTAGFRKKIGIVFFFFIGIDLCVYFMGKKRWPQTVLVLEVGIIIILLAAIVARLGENNENVETSITDWSSRYTTYNDGWYIDEDMVESTEDPGVFLFGPYIDLKKGYYSVTVEYECDYDQDYIVYMATESKGYVEFASGKLRQNQNCITQNFTLTRDIEGLEVVIKYGGHGALQVKNIEIEPDIAGFWINLGIIVYIFIIIDLSAYFAERKRWSQIVLVLEAGIIIFLLIAIAIRQGENNEVVDISITDWSSQYTIYDNGWYIDESMVESKDEMEKDREEEGVKVLQGPRASLRKGTYTVKVEYECDENQVCYESGLYMETGLRKILSKNQTTVNFDFTVKEDTDNFEVIVLYNGEGKLKIKNIEVRHTVLGFQRMLFVVLLSILCLDICYCFRNYIKDHRLLILKLCAMILLVSCPLFIKGIHAGHDIMFHLMRIEGLAEELRRGVLPVKLSSVWMDGYGYPVSVFYGDLLLYIAAILRMIGFSVITAYKCYVFFINAGTVLIAYGCFKKIYQDSTAAFLTAFAYATAGYRIVDIYVRAAAGEYTAMMFFPLIALAVYQFYTLESEEWKFYKRYALVLALGMTGVIGSHILSTEMVVFILAVLCVVLWKRTLRKYVFRSYLLAVVETIVFNLYFIIPFLDYCRNVDVDISRRINYTQAIQEHGAYIGQYFSIFQNMFGWSGVGRASYTPGLALMAVLMIGVVLWVQGKAVKETKLFLTFSVFLLFMASNLFPWNHLDLHYRLGRLLSAVQFSWRYLGIAELFLTLLLGNIWGLVKKEEQCCKGFCALMAGSCLVMILFYISNYSNEGAMMYYYDTAEINTYSYVGGEYLRVGTNPEEFTGEIVCKNMEEVSLLSRNGPHMKLYCKASESDGTVELPMLNYKGYQIIDEYGNRYEIMDSKNKLIQFTVPAGFLGEIEVDFVEPWIWRIGEIVSLLTIIFFCVTAVRNYYNFKQIR